MKIFIKYFFLISLIYCTISNNKKDYIQNFLDKNQNEAIELINSINNTVKKSDLICQTIKNDDVDISIDIIKINEFLNCGKNIKNKDPSLKISELNDIRDFYDSFMAFDYLNNTDEDKFNKYYDELQNFYKNNKFSVKKN